ncbi:MAG TPA: hypothetical protein VIV66_05780 [Pyrinomonadaceae bacterium]
MPKAVLGNRFILKVLVGNPAMHYLLLLKRIAIEAYVVKQRVALQEQPD